MNPRLKIVARVLSPYQIDQGATMAFRVSNFSRANDFDSAITTQYFGIVIEGLYDALYNVVYDDNEPDSVF